MYNNALNIPLNDVDDSDCIPKDKYPMIFAEYEIKNTKDNEGMYVAATFRVCDGPRKGFTIFENFNVRNRNHKTVEIALKQIKRFIKAVGFSGNEQLTPDLLEACKGREFEGTVYIEEGRDGYAPKNRIGDYKPLAYSAAPAVSHAYQAPAPQTTQQATHTPPPPINKKPWEK